MSGESGKNPLAKATAAEPEAPMRNAASLTPPSSTVSGRVRNWIRIGLAMTVWSYAVVKLLFFDVDLWLAHRLVPGHVWLVQYRWLLAIVALTVFAIALRGPRLLGWTVYILFFPLILFFFHIPWALFKREAWTPAIVLVAAAVSVFKSFRWKLSFLSALLVGSFLVAASRKPALDLLGAALLIVVILLAYGWTVVRAFRSPPRMFSTEGLDKVWSFIRMPFELPKELKGSDPDAMT